MRIRFIKNSGRYKAGEIANLATEMAHNLVKKGIAIVSKDMTQRDYKVKRTRIRGAR